MFALHLAEPSVRHFAALCMYQLQLGTIVALWVLLGFTRKIKLMLMFSH
jgi:hypothetical protein